jgi:transcription initiation factor IIE alpha subunit
MKDKDINGDKRKELIKRVYETKLFTNEELSILTKIKLESIEGILKTF